MKTDQEKFDHKRKVLWGVVLPFGALVLFRILIGPLLLPEWSIAPLGIEAGFYIILLLLFLVWPMVTRDAPKSQPVRLERGRTRSMWRALLKRYAIILSVYPLLIVGLWHLPRPDLVTSGAAAGGLVMIYLVAGLIWANSILVHHISRMTAALLTAVLTFVIGSCVIKLTSHILQLIGRI